MVKSFTLRYNASFNPTAVIVFPNVIFNTVMPCEIGHTRFLWVPSDFYSYIFTIVAVYRSYKS